jgi:mannitol-1-/sugar-/sorbitol-6-/2-deoxyglucose-6-phosphatase
MDSLFHNISHIIFDLDGLLIDSEPLWEIAETNILARYGKIWTPEIGRQHIGLRIDEAAVVMVNAYQISLEPQILADEIYAEMLHLIDTSLILMPGAEETLQAFHATGYPLAIASSSSEAYINKVIQKYSWSSYIKVVASGDRVARGKPAPDVYLLAAQQLGVLPANCAALEDSLNGSKAARAAGMTTIAIPGHDFTPQDFDEIAHATFPSLLELLDILALRT